MFEKGDCVKDRYEFVYKNITHAYYFAEIIHVELYLFYKSFIHKKPFNINNSLMDQELDSLITQSQKKKK